MLLCSHLTNAQILNLEHRLLNATQSKEWLMRSSALFSVQQKRLSFIKLSAKLNLAYIRPNTTCKLIGKLSLLSIDREDINSDGYAHLRLNFMHKKSVSLEVFTQIQYDLLRDIQLRYLFGTGVRFALLKKENALVALGIAIMPEYEQWFYEEQEYLRFFWKNSNYISVYQDLNERVSYNFILYYQSNVLDWERWRLSADLNLNVLLTKKLRLTFSVTAFYDNKPILPIPDNNYLIENGLSFDF